MNWAPWGITKNSFFFKAYHLMELAKLPFPPLRIFFSKASSFNKNLEEMEQGEEISKRKKNLRNYWIYVAKNF